MLKDEINVKNEISFRKISLPSSQKNVLIWLVPLIRTLHIPSDEFTNMAERIALRKNRLGGSISEPLK